MKNNKKVLIIDDDEELCEEMSEILSDEGYLVFTENDGLQGYLKAQYNRYDVLLLDLKLPGMKGYDVLKNLKEKSSIMKIIVLTGRPLNNKFLPDEITDEFGEEKILKMADAVINKPFNINFVLSMIKNFTYQRI